MTTSIINIEEIENNWNRTVDLCLSDGEQDAAAPATGVAESASNSKKLPPTVFLLDSDDDDDDEVVPVPSFVANNKKRVLVVDDLSEDLDQKPRARRRRGEGALRAVLPVDDAISILKVNKAKDPFQAVFEIFPTVDPDHARKLYDENNKSVDRVVSLLATATSFPTSAKQHAGDIVIKTNKKASIEPKYDYMSRTSFEPSDDYRKQAHAYLCNEFRFMNSRNMQHILLNSNGHYAIARQHIHDALCGSVAHKKCTEEELDGLKCAAINPVLKTMRLTVSQTNRLGPKSVIKNPRQPRAIAVTDEILRDEIEYVKYKFDLWMQKVELQIRRRKLQEQTERSGTGVECSCCFDKINIDDMVACRNEGHLFCVDCLGNFAKNQIFSCGNLGIDPRTKQPSLELMCFHGDGCNSPFPMEHLRKALPETTMNKYNSLQCQLSLEKAGIDENMVSCPKCDYKAVLPDTQNVFCCPVEDCGFESCRKCGKVSHIPLRCDEVEKEKHKDQGRLAVEEAISEAKIRNCPKCKQPFIKSDGCNKMRCSCGAFSCYQCRQLIQGYQHFCQVPHCDHTKCGGCILHSNDAEDDKRAMTEAGISTAKGFLDKDVHIDVNKIMENPLAK